jgi:hypothetical protein
VHRKPRLEDVAVGLDVVDDQDACRIVHTLLGTPD